MEKCKPRSDRWLNRDLSLLSHILITKTESLPRCIYPAFSLPISNKAIKTINKLNFNFTRKRKSHDLKRASLVKDYEDGGLQAIGFDIRVKVVKSLSG